MSAPQGGLFGFALRPVGGLILFCIGAVAAFGVGEGVSQGLLAPICDSLIKAGQTCTLVYTSVQDAFFVVLKASLLAGFVLAIPCLLFQLSRVFAPTLFRHSPKATAIYAWAGGVIAIVAVVFVVYFEAPRAFSAAIDHIANTTLDIPLLGFANGYVRATLDMAGTYVALLQVPLIFAMMVKSMRLKRVLSTEVQS